jgi:hypothetical protein
VKRKWSMLRKLEDALDEVLSEAYYRTASYDEIKDKIISTIKECLKVDCLHEVRYSSETCEDYEILCDSTPPWIYYVVKRDEIDVREVKIVIEYEGVLMDYAEYPPDIFLTKYSISVSHNPIPPSQPPNGDGKYEEEVDCRQN